MTTAIRPRIGFLLVSRKVLTPAQVEECLILQDAMVDPKPLGEIIVSKGYAPPTEVKRAFKEQTRYGRRLRGHPLMIAAGLCCLALGALGIYLAAWKTSAAEAPSPPRAAAPAPSAASRPP